MNNELTIAELNFLHALKLLFKDAYYIQKVRKLGQAFLDIMPMKDDEKVITSILLVDRSYFQGLQYAKFYTFEDLGIKENN